MTGAWTSRNVAPPHQRRRGHGQDRDREVGRQDAGPGVPARGPQRRGQPVLEDEDVDGADAEHHERVPRQPVDQARPSGEPLELRHGQGVDVADAALVEVAAGGVVDGMAPPPMVVGGQGQDADRAAEPVVGPAAAEERAVAAVVLDHEQAHQEARGRDGQEQGQAVAGVAQAEPHQEPQGRERHGGDGQFGQAAGKAGLAVGCQDLRPAAGIVDGMGYRSDHGRGMSGHGWSRRKAPRGGLHCRS